MAVTITAKMVKDLKELTGAGMMDCKKALVEADGDQEKAVELLRKAGVAMAAKKANRIAAEGLVAVKTTQDNKKAAIVEVNSETDFVAKNAVFREFVDQVADQALTTQAKDMDAFKEEAWKADPSMTVNDALVGRVGVIHENLQIRRFEVMNSTGYIAPYVHGQGRIGVLVNLECQEVNDDVKKLGKNLAMQVAGMNPEFLDNDSVPQSFLDKEKEIILAQMDQDEKAKDKPQAIKEKMMQGKLSKRLKEVCLMDQVYFLNDEQTVAQYVKEASKEIGFPVTVKGFIRWECGEGLEKRQDDFAAEVAAELKK